LGQVGRFRAGSMPFDDTEPRFELLLPA